MGRLERKKRIGILGGTFDPIHIGHLVLAERAREELKLDKIIFIPAHYPPHKHRLDIAEAELRYKMVRLAISANKYFFASRIEIDKPRVSYSIDTLHALKKKHPKVEFFFIVGSDALPELDTWKRINEVFRLCTFAVAKRPGFEKCFWPKRVFFLSGIFLDISSSVIRQYIRRGKSVRYLLPNVVYQLIKRQNLYR